MPEPPSPRPQHQPTNPMLTVSVRDLFNVTQSFNYWDRITLYEDKEVLYAVGPGLKLCLQDGNWNRVPTQQESFVSDPPIIRLQIPMPEGSVRDFLYQDTPVGGQVVKEIFEGLSYPLVPMTEEVKTIVDIGAHVGAASLLFKMRWPTARLLAFEPAPMAFTLLKQNLAGLPDVQLYDVGLSQHGGIAPLYRGNDDGAMSSMQRWLGTAEESDTIQLRNASLALETTLGDRFAGIDILKIDTEGHEVPILRNLHTYGVLYTVGLLYIEFHRARDRGPIDTMMTEDHVLVRGRITGPHRGELVYCHRERIPESEHRLKIGE